MPQRYLLNAVYAALILVASPVIAFRMLFRGKYRRGWAEKLLGRMPVRTSTRPCLWLHAVSVGEVLQLETLLGQLSARFPDHEFVISTTTHTGFDVATRKYAAHQVCFFPLDFSWSVSRAIDRLKPQAILLVELELWPNFIHAAASRGIPVLLINGRISERSFRGYRRVKWVIGPVLRALSAIAAQNETYAERFVSLGARPNAVRVTGSIKFDRAQFDRMHKSTQELRRYFGIREDQRVFIAGSTQHPEENYALEAYLELRSEFPDLRLILVPRHKERFEEVARFVEDRGLPLVRRSQRIDSEKHATPILLLDTLGELSACWGLADIAFVGGSLTSRGGQNMIEPSAYGAAVCFGPNTQNFRDVVEMLLAGGAARVVSDGGELKAVVREYLRNPQVAREYGNRARELVLAQQGATGRTMAVIEDILAPSASGPGEIRAA